MGTISVNGINMYYEIHGTGTPIVLLGGFSADHIVWSAVLDHFRKSYQVILLDNRGAGRTEVPEGPYTIEQMARDVSELCLQLKIDRAHFVGSSMGGFVTQTLARDFPDLVQSMILCNTVTSPDAPYQVYLQAQWELRLAEVPQEALIKAACSWVFSHRFLSEPGTLDILVQLGARNPAPFTDRGYAGQYAALLAFNSEDWAGRLPQPALVLAGDEDIIFQEFLVKRLMDKLQDARYYCFRECGHLPQIEQPEVFYQVVHQFIQNLG